MTSLTFGSCMKEDPLDAYGGNCPVVIIRSDSIIVVLPLPLVPTMRVRGFWNVMTWKQTSLKSRSNDYQNKLEPVRYFSSRNCESLESRVSQCWSWTWFCKDRTEKRINKGLKEMRRGRRNDKWTVLQLWFVFTQISGLPRNIQLFSCGQGEDSVINIFDHIGPISPTVVLNILPPKISN